MRRLARVGMQGFGVIVIATACSSADDTTSSSDGLDGGGLPAGGGGFVAGGAGGGSAGVTTAPATCGNGVLDAVEDCDGADFGGETCASMTMNARPTGSLTCAGCRIDVSTCLGGNGGSVGTGGGASTGTGGGDPGSTGGTPNSAGGTPSSAGGTIGGTGGSTGANGETGRMVGMTDAHNQVRSQVGTPPLTWSPTIAAVAQAYADQLAATNGCNMVHSHNPSYGENLAWFSGSPSSAQGVVNAWAGEGACWVHGDFMTTDQCNCPDNACGHYTQVVWRTTTEVGCGVATCANSEVWVCNYSPPGNYVGESVY